MTYINWDMMPTELDNCRYEEAKRIIAPSTSSSKLLKAYRGLIAKRWEPPTFNDRVNHEVDKLVPLHRNIFSQDIKAAIYLGYEMAVHDYASGHAHWLDKQVEETEKK